MIIHRVVAHEDPPFRPNIPCMEMKPEYIELMVDCWDDDPEERPHFYRIVERLKKISGRYGDALASPDRAVRVRALAGDCVVFVGKTLNSHSASLHPGVYMGTGEFNAGGNPAMD